MPRSFSRIGLAALFALALLSTCLAHFHNIQDQTELPKRVVSSLAVWTLAAAWLATALGSGRVKDARSGWTSSRTGWLLLGFAAWQLLVLPFAASPSQGVSTVVATIEAAAWFLLAWQILANRAARRLVVLALVVSGVVTAVMGLLQYAAAYPGSFPFRHAPLDGLLAAWRSRAGGFFGSGIAQADVPASVFGHTNFAGEFVAMVAPLALVGGLAAWRRRGLGQRASAALLLAASALMGLFLVRTGSRGAMLAFGVAMAFGWSWLVFSTLVARPLFGSRPLHGLLHVLLALAVVAGGALAADQLKTSPRHGQRQTTVLRRLMSSVNANNTTVRERVDLWANTVPMIRDRPVFGVGPGNYKVAYPRYAGRIRPHELGRITLRRQPEKPHNEVIGAAAENGIFGAVLWLAPIIGVLAAGLRRTASGLGRPDPERIVAVAALMSLIAVLVASMVSFPFHQTGTRVAFWVLAALLLRLARPAHAPPPVPISRRAALAGVFVCALAFCQSAAHYRARVAGSHMMALASGLRARGDMVGDRTHSLLEQRLRLVDSAVTRVPHDYRYELHRADLLGRLGERSLAEASLLRALDLHPNLVNAWVSLAELYLGWNRLEAARSAAAEAVALNPRDARVHLTLGRVMAAFGRSERALEAYARALQVEPVGFDRLRAHLELALLFARRDDWASAGYHIQRAQTLAPGDRNVIATQARLLEEQSPGSVAAFRAWQRLMAVDPEHAEARMRVAQGLISEGRHDAALALLDEAYVRDPSLSVLLYHRARALVGLQRLREARDSLYECMKHCAKFSHDMALWNRCRDLVGEIERRRGAAMDGARTEEKGS